MVTSAAIRESIFMWLSARAQSLALMHLRLQRLTEDPTHVGRIRLPGDDGH
jgi:hypothetical protein